MTIEHTADIEILPARRPAQSEALGQLMAHAQAMSAAKQLGDALSQTEMVPATYRGKPGNAAAAILYGAELGLDPIQSLQQIFVVHGAPAIYARTAVALVKRHGILVETVSSTDDAVCVRATDARTGQVEEATWDIARAQQAGYTTNTKYRTNPQEMLYAKAAMEVCRKVAPDVLLGVPYSREELDLEVKPQRVRPERVARGVDGLRAAMAGPAEPSPDAAPPVAQDHEQPRGMSAPTRSKWLNRMFQLLTAAQCGDRDNELAVISALAGVEGLGHRDALTDGQLKTVVNQLNTWDKAGELVANVGEILDQAAIASADATEPTALDETVQ